LLVTIAGNTTTYHHPDHLSNRAETDSSGIQTRTFGQLPFGETWYETGTADKWKFTSYERDSGTGETGLDYANFRYYSSAQGRFMSADLMSGSIGSPQSLNRYSYTGNDPINGVDPLGLDTLCATPYITTVWSDGHKETIWGSPVCFYWDPFFVGVAGIAPFPLSGADSAPDCVLAIRLNNKANLTDKQLKVIQDAIQSLFSGGGTSLGVSFVSANADYTLNINNAGSNDKDLGHQTSFFWGLLQFTPVMHPNKIGAAFSTENAYTVANIMGQIGAHELVHRINGTGDLPYDPAHPNDLMSTDNNPNQRQGFVDGSYRISSSDLQKLLQNCLKKHPKK
jgi:RHS repeat-associated protein